MYFTRKSFSCTLHGNLLRVLYEEMNYVYFTREKFTWFLRGKGLRGFYEEIVYVAFTRKFLTPLYDESFPCKFTMN